MLLLIVSTQTLPMHGVPFVKMHVWKQNMELDMDYMGISIGWIPMNMEGQHDQQNNLTTNKASYRFLHFIAKVFEITF